MLLLLLCVSNLFADKRVTTTITPHSPAINAARELAGWQNFVNISETKGLHGAFAITPEFTLSFRPERIAQCFFGDAILKCANTLHIVGSQKERVDADWLADYFGLPTDYESRVHFDPRVAQALVDFDLQLEWNHFYARIHAPIAHSRWDLNMCETFVSTGTNGYDPGYFNADGIEREQLVDNFTSFIMGCDSPQAEDITFQTLKHAKMGCRQNLTKISDVQIALGYNILQKKRYHLGFNLRCSIPTGNRPTGEYLFEPIIGNGHHWELGAGLSTHYTVWHNEETHEHAGLYFDMNITHLFSASQKRSFDLCGSHNSRYMLAHKLTPTITNNLRGIVEGEQTTPTAQYDNEVSTIANLTTLPIKVSASLQADLAVMIGYTQRRNSWGFGYGFWGRSCEDICLCGDTPFDTQLWAVKGDAQLFGFANDGLETPIALSATQRNATVKRGKNTNQTGATTNLLIAQAKRNEKIDNPASAIADPNGDGTFETVVTLPSGVQQINTSIQPIILTTNDIDSNSARTRASAHKIFGHFNHIIKRNHSTPYIGFGAEIEFGQGAVCDRFVSAGSPPCVNTALSFWAVWLKGGIAF